MFKKRSNVVCKISAILSLQQCADMTRYRSQSCPSSEGRGGVQRGWEWFFFYLTLTSAQGCDYLLLSIMFLEKSHTKSRTHHRCITGLRRSDVETEFGKRTLSSTKTIAHIFRWNFDQNRTIMIQDDGFENAACNMAAILTLPQCVDNMVLKGVRFPPMYITMGSRFSFCVGSERIQASRCVADRPLAVLTVLAESDPLTRSGMGRANQRCA